MFGNPEQLTDRREATREHRRGLAGLRGHKVTPLTAKPREMRHREPQEATNPRKAQEGAKSGLLGGSDGRPERAGGDLLQMFGPKQSHQPPQKRPRKPQRAPEPLRVRFTGNGEKWQNGLCERLQSHRAKADTLRSVPKIPEPIRSDSLEADKKELAAEIHHQRKDL